VTLEEVSRCSVPRKRFDDLLRGPLRSRVFGDVEVNNLPSIMCQNHEDEQHLNVIVGTVKKSTETRSFAWLDRNVRQL